MLRVYICTSFDVSSANAGHKAYPEARLYTNRWHYFCTLRVFYLDNGCVFSHVLIKENALGVGMTEPVISSDTCLLFLFIFAYVELPLSVLPAILLVTI
jgi:hypothetical protein